MAAAIRGARKVDMSELRARKMIEDGNLTTLEALRFKNEYRRIGPERDRVATAHAEQHAREHASGQQGHRRLVGDAAGLVQGNHLAGLHLACAAQRADAARDFKCVLGQTDAHAAGGRHRGTKRQKSGNCQAGQVEIAVRVAKSLDKQQFHPDSDRDRALHFLVVLEGVLGRL